jgi:hypothetical protein
MRKPYVLRLSGICERHNHKEASSGSQPPRPPVPASESSFDEADIAIWAPFSHRQPTSR